MGYFRLLLALLVMVAHVGPRPRPFESLMWWHWAVAVFFVLSGYLATLGMNGKYRDNPKAFLINRALRILPTYWVVLAGTLIGFWLIGDQPDMQPLMLWPTPLELLKNVLLIIPIDTIRSAPVTVAWTLSVDALHYILIAMGLFSCSKRTWFILAGSMAWGIINPPFYNDTRWALPVFSLGASLYWAGWKMPGDGVWSAWAGAISYPLFLVHSAIGAFMGDWLMMPFGWPLFLDSLPPSLALSWLLVVAVERPIARYRKTFQTTKET